MGFFGRLFNNIFYGNKDDVERIRKEILKSRNVSEEVKEIIRQESDKKIEYTEEKRNILIPLRLDSGSSREENIQLTYGVAERKIMVAKWMRKLWDMCKESGCQKPAGFDNLIADYEGVAEARGIIKLDIFKYFLSLWKKYKNIEITMSEVIIELLNIEEGEINIIPLVYRFYKFFDILVDGVLAIYKDDTFYLYDKRYEVTKGLLKNVYDYYKFGYTRPKIKDNIRIYMSYNNYNKNKYIIEITLYVGDSLFGELREMYEGMPGTVYLMLFKVRPLWDEDKRYMFTMLVDFKETEVVKDIYERYCYLYNEIEKDMDKRLERMAKPFFNIEDYLEYINIIYNEMKLFMADKGSEVKTIDMSWVKKGLKI